MATHDLKTWPTYFEQVWKGKKKFEVRKNDRGFTEGDTLTLMEFDPSESTDEKQVYTGRWMQCNVNYILEGGQFGIEPGYCCMSITVTNRHKP